MLANPNFGKNIYSQFLFIDVLVPVLCINIVNSIFNIFNRGFNIFNWIQNTCSKT